MKILIMIPCFEEFDNLNTFLVEIPYKIYIKELVAEINDNRELFPTKQYFINLKGIKNINNHEVKNDNVYLLVSENLKHFMLFGAHNRNIIDNKKIEIIDKNLFALINLPFFTIKLGIEKYVIARDEIFRLSNVHDDFLNFDIDIFNNISLFTLLDIINNKEQINSHKKSIKILINEITWKNTGFKYINKENDGTEIIWEENWTKLIIIEYDENYRFVNIAFIEKDNVIEELNDNRKILNRIALNKGIIFSKNDFIDSEEKYFEMFKDKM